MFTSKEEFKKSFTNRLELKGTEKSLERAHETLWEMTCEWVQESWKRTNQLYEENQDKQLYYMSIEFLIGRVLGQNLQNLNFYNMVKEGLDELGLELSEIEELEIEPGLGNGGLGRLAACFMDSLASLELPGHGYGLRYRGGLFTQHFVNGNQTEQPTNWIKDTNNVDTRREDLAVDIPYYGEVQLVMGLDGMRTKIENPEWVKAVPYDIPIVGANGGTVNTLRLWQAEVSDRSPSVGKEYAVYERETAHITDRLYPDDSLETGKILRLKQQYLLCSASLQNIISNHKSSLEKLPDSIAIQINDTHPALAVPELMRILIDDYAWDWERAWDVTTRTISYTNHTILEEAMEKWDSHLIQSLLPRIYLIIEEIDRRFKESLQNQEKDDETLHKLSIIENGVIKMAVLAVVGSYKVNGVAKLHTEILKKREMKELNEQFPNKFHNKTNGITHRRWLIKANQELSGLITETIGSQWMKEPERLSELHYFSQNQNFLQDFQTIKSLKKEQLIHHLQRDQNIIVDPSSIFDIHIKRFHGYKRQLMNILHIQMLYDRIKRDSTYRPYPRTFFFGGKAAPSYHFAKQVIKMINTVATKVNNDPLARQHLHIVFVENYNVTQAEYLIPAADVSEQISTASKEASGTGNMKFMMNGALTIGTFDGANVEIFEQVGQENAFVFGMRAEQVMEYEKNHSYNPKEIIESDVEIEKLMEELVKGDWTEGKANADFIVGQLLHDGDPYFVLKDLQSYAKAHEKILDAYANPVKWAEMGVKNIAASGIFSSDRTIQQYSDDVWHLTKVPSIY
ncbi:glycogen/starch/alpha-glucan phosphorylase [Planococcus halocryophilus]|uniref:glycogen/starch/alpha-glucan phosphorylase n=1 Tax=Planococcus halocryophilus TaxID=1215089 RepID=UPI001F0D9D11|nr:glycogen/starch/alpha-glucan family phosphorylase [Planococcus halocryophilus]MCH4826421.1 glycogen/starch/alpha-glucan family phosphorylase [Planococcus halocryophilus]